VYLNDCYSTQRLPDFGCHSQKLFMQNLLFQLCLGAALTLLMGCNKKTHPGTEGSTAQLVGTWELREAQSGMIPNMQHAPGNGNRYQFTETAYEQYTNGDRVKSGAYQVVTDTTVQKEVGLELPAGQFTHRIIFDNDPSATKIFFQISAGKLLLLSGYFPTDGGSRLTYEKTGSGR
jgi:hypothetical protein